MNTPQTIWIVLVAMNAIIYMMKHGEYLKYNFWSYLISAILTTGLLYWGGFFTNS